MVRRYMGFSLIELMITVAVVAILSAVAYPSYQQYLLTSHRVDAKKMLLDAANRQEIYFMDFNQYASTVAALGINAQSESGYYDVAIAVVGNSYIMSATPVGSQAKDTGCTQFAINEVGVKTATGTAANDCWN